MVGIYALITQPFPTAVHAGVIGIGRDGGAIRPILADFLFQLDFGLPLIGAMLLTSLPPRPA